MKSSVQRAAKQALSLFFSAELHRLESIATFPRGDSNNRDRNSSFSSRTHSHSASNKFISGSFEAMDSISTGPYILIALTGISQGACGNINSIKKTSDIKRDLISHSIGHFLSENRNTRILSIGDSYCCSWCFKTLKDTFYKASFLFD